MSILPSQTQGSTSSSSSSALSSNPNSHHGDLLQRPPSPPSSFSRQIQAFGSLRISDFQSCTALPGDNPCSLAAAAEDSGGSSEKVTEVATPKGRNVFPQQDTSAHTRCHSGGQATGSAYSRGKRSGTITSSQNQQSSGSVSSHGSSQSSGRKAQMVNGNHLLNFYYDPISRPQLRGPPPPPRRQQKRKAYNKDLFLQANYKFVVLDSGNYSPESMDPDKMLLWEDIICVRYLTPLLVQCPICLEHPLCPQITSCGHIFCFPCILQYLLMGDEDHKGDCWKRCPLCFVMISQKDLYTIYIENVKLYFVGETIEFKLLTREKDSFTLSHKNKQETDSMPCCESDLYDPFSKFTFTSDVELSVRKAISDLDSWLVRADSGLVDDLEKLPYVCAAMEQLEKRKKYWNEHQASHGDKSLKITNSQSGFHIPSTTTNVTARDYGERSCGLRTSSTDADGQDKGSCGIISDKLNVGACSDQSVNLDDISEGKGTNLSSSYDEKQNFQRHLNGSRDVKDNSAYNFYQASDGQHLILHPLNMKCLLHYYGSCDMLPRRISGRILQLETITQSEVMRRRYRFLSHFSLTTTFQLCEIDMSEILPFDALGPFMDEIKKREKQRKQLAKKERKEKMKAEAANTHFVPILSAYTPSSHDDPPTFSMDDFEALGNSATTTSPPVVGERKLFSNVTRHGFAAAHDSPSLKIQESSSLHYQMTTESRGVTGSRNLETPSFANVMSREKSTGSLDARKMNELGKKGKKLSRVLLSTSAGRRY
ncbi:RING finger protein 10 [Quillaja saponaria]|uniref:RING finger protein 10 n=1 Tax=Quillaja saponaria TaxID=32244 RepID=A0AAD7VHX6_QUISA|nr:RING finger protein 10 [Quillaja saponaria]